METTADTDEEEDYSLTVAEIIRRFEQKIKNLSQINLLKNNERKFLTERTQIPDPIFSESVESGETIIQRFYHRL